MTSVNNKLNGLLKELCSLANEINPSEIIYHIDVTHGCTTLDAQWLDAWHEEFNCVMRSIAETLEDNEEAVAFCKRIEKAAKGREPLTVFGVDYFATAGGDPSADNAPAHGTLNATLGSSECEVVASSAEGLTTDNLKQWFRLSCGHAFKLYGLGMPVACPICGKAVKR